VTLWLKVQHRLVKEGVRKRIYDVEDVEDILIILGSIIVVLVAMEDPRELEVIHGRLRKLPEYGLSKYFY